MRKKLIGLVFTVCLMCSACTAKNQSEQPQSSDLNQAKQLEIQTVQETENDSQSYWGTVAHNFAKGEGGYYYMDNGDSYLMFFDEETQESYPLCALPNCQHNTTDCNAYVGTQKGTGYLMQTVYYYKDSLYLLNSEGFLVRFSPDGAQREKIVQVYQYGQGDTGTNLVFHNDYVYVYNMNQHLGMEEEYAETITRYSLDGKEQAVVAQYTGESCAIMQAKCYGNQLFFIISDVQKQNVNDKVVLNQAYKGLYVYRTDTMEAGRVLEQEVTGYCIDENTNKLFYFVKEKGLYSYDINTKEQKLLVEADEKNQMPEISFDGQYVYMDNSAWASISKRMGKEVEKQCFVIDTNGNMIQQISGEKTQRIYFGDGNYLFAKTVIQKISGGNSEYSYINKSLPGEWEWKAME